MRNLQPTPSRASRGGATPILVTAVMAIALTLLLAACGSSDPTATPRPTATPIPATPTPLPPGVTAVPTPTPRPTATPDASFEAQWNELIAAAQKEGGLVIAGGGGVARLTITRITVLRIFQLSRKKGLVISSPALTAAEPP